MPICIFLLHLIEMVLYDTLCIHDSIQEQYDNPLLASLVHSFGTRTSFAVVVFRSYVGMPTDRFFAAL